MKTTKGQDMKATNEQLKDVNWWDANQPSKAYSWAEDLNLNPDSDFEGWCIKDEYGGWTMYENDEEARWDDTAESQGSVKIHRRPEPAATPYQPEVGEWCEWVTDSMDNQELFYIGINDKGHKVFHDTRNRMSLNPNDVGIYRPIKTEREQFIEQALTLKTSVLIHNKDWLIEMHKAGFKAPE